jgi:hypothetical protein
MSCVPTSDECFGPSMGTRMWAIPVLFLDGVPKPIAKTLFLSCRAICRCSAPVLSCDNRVATSSNSGTSFTCQSQSQDPFLLFQTMSLYLIDRESRDRVTGLEFSSEGCICSPSPQPRDGVPGDIPAKLLHRVRMVRCPVNKQHTNRS